MRRTQADGKTEWDEDGTEGENETGGGGCGGVWREVTFLICYDNNEQLGLCRQCLLYDTKPINRQSY